MTPFELVSPASLREAIGLLDPDDPSVRALAGGTALMLMMKAGVFKPARLVSLRSIEPEYSTVEAAKGGGLRIGALATLSSLEHSPLVKREAPVIARTLLTLSNVRVRNVATVGGSLAHADPHMDLPPVMVALGATIRVSGPAGSRDIPAEALITGYYETALARDELISEVVIPAQGGRRSAYLKVTTRSADDWPALGVAVVLSMEGPNVREARVVASAATEVPQRLSGAEAVLKGARIDEKVLARAGDAAVDEAAIVAGVHGSAAYRKALLRVAVGRAVRKALAETA
jgi:aerobic carbon-monoxide dehydrogenase medium subunit